MISKRIRTIASLIDDSFSVTDIGCDHGYLAICLRQSGNQNRIICSDNKQGPLDHCRRNLAPYGFENIEYVLSSGLDDVDEMTDAAVIAGMGFQTIKMIISAHAERFRQYRQVIIQSNNSLPSLRRYLNSAGFQIDREILIEDDKWYTVLVVYAGKQKLSTQEYSFGFGLGKQDPDEFRRYWNYQLEKKERILQGIRHDNPAYQRMENEIRKIREVL